MSKKKAAVILLCTAFGVLLLTLASSHLELQSSLFSMENGTLAPEGMTIVTQEQWNALLLACEETPADPSAILWDNSRLSYVDAAYTASGCTLYVPQNREIPLWEGSFRAKDDADILILQDDYLSDKAAAIQDGHIFTCMVTDGDTCSLFSVIMTGTATVSLEYDNSSPLTEQQEPHDAFVRVRGTDGSCVESVCSLHVRGASTAGMEKKSYKFSLREEDGSNRKLSICGLRSDDDWILNAMYQDQLRIREPLTYQVWSQMLALSGNPAGTTDMVYAEVFLNNEYIGLYALMEPVDARTFQLDEGDLLYKITDSQLPALAQDGNMSGAELKWPKESEGGASDDAVSEEDAGDTWAVLQAISLFAGGDLSWEDLRETGVYLDISQLALYELLIELADAGDNTWKNMYLVCLLQTDGTYVVTQSPWDVNGTWGDDYSGAFRADNAAVADRIHSVLWQAYEQDCPEEAQALLSGTWRSLRDAGLGPEDVCGQAEQLWGDAVGSGSAIRDAALYPGTVDGDNYDQTLEWITARFAALDAFYAYEGTQVSAG